MAAKHKLSGSHIRITTAKADAGKVLLTIAETVATDLTAARGRTSGMKMFQFAWQVEHSDANSLLISIGNDRKSGMKWSVTAEESPTGSALSTRIVFFRTLQSKLYGLIPTGPKRLVGYENYKRYMVALGQAVEAWDPQCTVQITERLR